jgi:hypothetical protein
MRCTKQAHADAHALTLRFQTLRKDNKDHQTGSMAEMYGGFFTPQVVLQPPALFL